MAYALKVFILADNKQAIRAFEQTATAAGASADEIVAADEKTVAANRETSASFSDMKRGVTLVGTVAFAALAFGMDKGIKAALAWQVQQTALQQALKNTGNYSKAALENINSGVERLATHGGFAESLQIPAVTQLIGETGSLTAAQRLNVAATNLARGAHIDYASAISKVEGAMIGQTRGISKMVGTIVPVTQYTYGWTAAMKAADSAGYAAAVRMNKQATAAEILGMVQKKYGDQTKAFNNSLPGQLSNLHNAFEILLRQLGQMLLPTIHALATAFAHIADWMRTHMPLVRELAKQFLGIAAAVGAIVTVWKLWNEAKKIGDLLAAADPWLLALMAIAAVAAEVVLHWKAVSGAVVSVFNSIGTAVTAVWDGLKSGFVAVVNFISGMINKFIIAPLNAVLSLGGLLGGGPVPNIPRWGGAATTTASAGRGPTPQNTVGQNTSNPASQHRAGGDSHTTIPVQVNIDGRVVAETVVHHVQKRVALS